jgi:hypothetical protein
MTPPVFETPRLILRSITEQDAEGLHEAYGDADAMRHWDLPPSGDVSQTVSASARPPKPTHAGMACGQSRPRGAVRGRDQLRQRASAATRAGWIVVPSLWRQGIMTEAAPPVISLLHPPERIGSKRGSSRRTCRHGGWLRSWLHREGLLRD